MKKLNWHNIRLVLIIVLMIFLYSFSLKKNNERLLKSVNISFAEDKDNYFITHEMVNNLLIQNSGKPLSIKKEKVDLNTLETALNDHEMIEKAEVFSSIDGSLNAHIKQKTPIVRFVSDNAKYYLDGKGDRMPLSENFSARVPVVIGQINVAEKSNYVYLFNEIAKDDFLKKSITGLTILPSGSIVMTNRDYEFKIIFGNPINVDKKLKNYKAFYKHAIKDTLIKNYKSVNLLFTDQVVCKK
ncbi:cell division protein FtsQ/DivIB [Flavobacterium sp.]|uniref:cell division protein FtsQ/DivIB n=1 Tax=Flavobacterium sp. TaxID=239 RepID=UPI003D2989C8